MEMTHISIAVSPTCQSRRFEPLGMAYMGFTIIEIAPLVHFAVI